jgi:putative transposase
MTRVLRSAAEWGLAIRTDMPGRTFRRGRRKGEELPQSNHCHDEDWPWSSVRAHLAGRDGALVTVKPVLDQVGNFARLLAPDPEDETAFAAVRAGEGKGRPLANAEFIAGPERLLDRPIARRAPRTEAERQGPTAEPAVAVGVRDQG